MVTEESENRALRDIKVSKTCSTNLGSCRLELLFFLACQILIWKIRRVRIIMLRRNVIIPWSRIEGLTWEMTSQQWYFVVHHHQEKPKSHLYLTHMEPLRSDQRVIKKEQKPKIDNANHTDSKPHCTLKASTSLAASKRYFFFFSSFSNDNLTTCTSQSNLVLGRHTS